MAIAEIVLILLKLIAGALDLVRQNNAEPKIFVYTGKGNNAALADHYRTQWDERMRAFKARSPQSPASGPTATAPTSGG